MCIRGCIFSAIHSHAQIALLCLFWAPSLAYKSQWSLLKTQFLSGNDMLHKNKRRYRVLENKLHFLLLQQTTGEGNRTQGLHLALPSSEKLCSENFSFPFFSLFFQNQTSLRQIFTGINLDSFSFIVRRLCKCLLLCINSTALHTSHNSISGLCTHFCRWTYPLY